eukprot:UN23483
MLTLLLILFLAHLIALPDQASTSSSETSPRSPFVQRPRSTEFVRQVSPLTPCQRELRSGRYEEAIAQEFPQLQNNELSVTNGGVDGSLSCHCVSGSRMECNIVCLSNEMRRIITERLFP